MGDSFLKLQEMCSLSQTVCIEVYGILNTGVTPYKNIRMIRLKRAVLLLESHDSFECNINLFERCGKKQLINLFTAHVD